MEEDQLKALQSKNAEKVKSVLRKFNETNAALFDFTSFNNNGQWVAIWKTIFGHLQNPDMEAIYPICLNTIRILTRDDTSVQSHHNEEDIKCLLKLSQLDLDNTTDILPHSTSTETVIEALKCLCNIVFQSSDCRDLCIKNACTENLIRRVSSANQLCHDIDFFDMKLLFLITAMEPSARTKVQFDLNGQVYLTHLLDEKLQYTHFTDAQIDLLCEILKVLFNITSTSNNSSNESEIQNRHLTSIIRCLFLKFGSLVNERELNVISHAINLLTNISSACLSELLIKCDSKGYDSSQKFEGWNIRVLEILLQYLRKILKEKENMASANEIIPPVLTVLVKCVRCNPIMRHYIRREILPPLKDVSQRPEVGNDLRNYLCRFLTMPEMILHNLSAELLFVCCKENVGRMIKYTGYGNAAGLFAKRGLLDCRTNENTEYSSDSEDSDTEEYKRVQENVNPVIGCYEPPRPSPFEGMSEEQKEHEAMQLVTLMDKLQRSGVIQPCRIGEDGTPQPVDHILELQEELPQQQLEQKRKC